MASPDRGLQPAAKRSAEQSAGLKQHQTLSEAEHEILGLIATRAKLSEILERAVRTIQENAAPALCSIMLVDHDGKQLSHIAGKYLPDELIKALGHVSIKSDDICCASAAFDAKSVFVRDIAQLDEADKLRRSALPAGLRACWSEPIVAQDGSVLGTFNLFYPEPGLPPRSHRSIVALLRPIVVIAIEFDQRLSALRAADERFDYLATGIPGVVYQRLVTPDGDIRYTYISDGAYDLFGVTAQQILADPNALLDRHDPSYAENFRQHLLEASRKLEMWDVEATIISADGKQKFTHAIARPIRQPDGSVIWNGLILDQTRIKKAEMAAVAAEASTREAIVESLSQGLVMFNDQDRLTICNSAFRKLLPTLETIAVNGAGYEDIIRAEMQLHATGPESEPFEEQLKVRMFHHTLRHHTFEKQLADGRWILISERRTSDRGAVILYTDITKFKEKEEDRRKLQDQFYRAQKLDAIGRLAGSIAHDFNNILAAILGNATFLLDDLPPGTEPHEFAKQIVAGGERAKTLVQQILMFSRHHGSEHENLDPRALVAETGQLMRAALPTSIELNVKVQSGDALISGNSTQLVQVLMNLCVNSRDAIGNQHGTIDLETEVLAPDAVIDAIGPDAAGHPVIRDDETRIWFGELAPNKPYARIRVRDNGCGMKPEVIEKMFEPFFTTKEVGQGTGLGLAAVHGIVLGHGGLIVVASKGGTGTCFDIYLPTLATGAHSAKPSQPQMAPLGSESILVVDDEEQVSAVVARSLGRLGYKVECFNSAVTALEALKKSPDKWSLVITDHTMPKMTGYELAKALAKEAPHLPVILCSGYSDGVSTESAKAIGIRTVLNKPVDLANLARAVRSLLDEQPNQSQSLSDSAITNI